MEVDEIGDSCLAMRMDVLEGLPEDARLTRLLDVITQVGGTQSQRLKGRAYGGRASEDISFPAIIFLSELLRFKGGKS